MYYIQLERVQVQYDRVDTLCEVNMLFILILHVLSMFHTMQQCTLSDSKITKPRLKLINTYLHKVPHTSVSA